MDFLFRAIRLIRGYYTYICNLGKKILIVVWYMNDNGLEEKKARGKESSYNALAEIQGRNVDGWKMLVEIGRYSNE